MFRRKCSSKELEKKLDEALAKLDELTASIEDVWRAIDRVNDTIAEKFEGEEFIGEITEDDIGSSNL